MPAPLRSLNDLMQAARANIDRNRSQRRQSSLRKPRLHPPILKMSAEISFTSRTADQEIDTVAICPEHPEYMVIGTYSLLKPDSQRSYAGQTRQGTLQVLTVSPEFRPKYAGMLPPQLDRISFPSAVVDIHFHPSDGTLLGVATSNAQVHIFRFIKHGDVLGRRVITTLLPLGSVTVSGSDEHGLTALVTQFTWFPDLHSRGVLGISDVQDISFAAVTSFGETKIVRTSVARIKDLYDQRVGPDQDLPPLPVTIVDVHKHDLEAWTVATVALPSPDESENGTIYRMILSGGDDSALIASAIELPNPRSEPGAPSVSTSDPMSPTAMPLWKDRRNHTAGVVAILPLPQLTIWSEAGLEHNDRKIIPLLTGSYDEHLRVFGIDPRTYRATFKTEMRLAGGVWRLKVLDHYTTTTGEQRQHHTLILASLMHAGAAIIRLTYTPSSSNAETWTINLLSTFRAGHESMVYCCDATLEGAENEARHVGQQEAPSYTVVSTSFYDMNICTWRFVDDFKAQHRAQSWSPAQ
ncbi:hypothetical protein LTR67_010268 [Exophiala xenobiotica]